jgi:hypothetical protein
VTPSGLWDSHGAVRRWNAARYQLKNEEIEMSGLDFGSAFNPLSELTSALNIGLAVETGGMSLVVEQAMKQAAGEVISNSLSGALNELGITGSQNQFLTDICKSSFDVASGNVSGLSQDVLSLANDFVEAAYQHGGLATATQQLQQTMSDFLTKSAQQDDSGANGASGRRGGSESWLIALAEAMGHQLGAKAQELSNLSTRLQNESSNADNYNSDILKLQGVSQEFGLMSSAFNTVIKAVGEGLSNLARKS